MLAKVSVGTPVRVGGDESHPGKGIALARHGNEQRSSPKRLPPLQPSDLMGEFGIIQADQFSDVDTDANPCSHTASQ